MANKKMEEIKRKTIELYDQLPQEEEARKARIDIRDQIIELNYSYFGYIASHKYINNNSVTYEDKLQSTLLHFCECWYWYRWEGHYRTDLSFTVFFKLRLGEMVARELNEVKYSVRRSLCMAAGKQIDKHWAKVKYEDLANVDLPANKMASLHAIFGTTYYADMEDHETFLQAKEEFTSELDKSDGYCDTLEEVLIQEMIRAESKLSDKHLEEIAKTYDVPFPEVKNAYVAAKQILYDRLKTDIDIQDAYYH